MLAESQALKSLQQFQFKRMQVIYTNGNPLLQIQLKPQLSTAAYCISISLQFLQSNQILRNCFENLDQLKHYLCQNPSKLQIVRKVDIILNITMLTKHHQIVLPVCQIQNGKAQAMNQQKMLSQVDLKTKQFKKAVRKLVQNHEPNKVFQRLVGALGMAFGDPKKIQKTYGLIGLLNMVPSIKISQPYYCVDKQMVVLLLDFIKQGKLLFQALWMLINGSTGHLHYRIWLEKGATQMFLGFLDSNEVKIVELALHGIFKLAYDYRDKILELGAIYKIITTLQRFDHGYTELADNGFRALYNILRRRPLLRYEVAETVLVKIIIGITDQLIQDSFVQKQCIISLSEYLEPMHQNIISKIASFQKFACLLESDDQYLFPATCKIITAAIVSQLQSIQKLSISCLLDPLVEHLKNEKRVIRITGQRRECKEITIKKRAFALVYTLACSSKNIHEILAHKDLMCALLTQGIFNDYPPNINEIVPQFFYNILVKGQYPQVYECLKNIPIMSYLYRLCFSQNYNTSFQIGMQILSNVLAFEEWCQFEGQKHLANQLHNMVRGDLNRILNDCSSKGRKCKRLIHRFLSLYPQQKNSAKSSRMYIQQKHSG